MKAAVLRILGQPLAIQDGIEVPPPGRGQVLVRVAYTGVCHSQLMEARGLRGPDRFLPHLLGHEGSGVVTQTGEGVTKLKNGQKVVLGWIKGAGLDGGGVIYRRAGEVINAGPVATFAEMAVVSENRCVPLPDGVPMDVAALFGCAVPTGAGIVFNTIRPDGRETIAVLGLGGIGLSALAAAHVFGCRTLAIDVEPRKLALAREMGASEIIDAGNEDVRARVMALTHGQGADYCIEAAGRAATIELGFSLVRRGGGRCIFASHPPAEERIRLDPFELICGKRIDGSWGGESFPDRDVPAFCDHYRAGRLKVGAFLGDRYTLERVNDALDDLEQRRITRALVEIAPELS
jgi:S-(hydroxymethyl)glutathione dehydrogenase / alcohol dehydrogenase